MSSGQKNTVPLFIQINAFIVAQQVNMEPATALTILGTAIGGAKPLEKLLGPTAEYLGEGLREWTEHRVQNVRRIFKKAADRLGDEMERPGGIPPRILKEVLQDGSFCEDELVAEYYGGILASGRTETGRDDRAATYLKLTSQLSTYQLRLHFVLYTVLRRKFAESELRPTFAEDLDKMAVHLPNSLLKEAMEFSQHELGPDIMMHCVHGLGQHQLIKPLMWGNAQHLNNQGKKGFGVHWQEVKQAGFIIGPTSYGIDFFLWAMGTSTSKVGRFLDPELQVAEVPGITIPDSASIVIGEPS